jgi:hypothetical protein
VNQSVETVAVFILPQPPPLGAAERICSVYTIVFVQCLYDLRATLGLGPESHDGVPRLLARDAVTLLRRDGTHIEVARATLEQEGSWGDAA